MADARPRHVSRLASLLLCLAVATRHVAATQQPDDMSATDCILHAIADGGCHLGDSVEASDLLCLRTKLQQMDKAASTGRECVVDGGAQLEDIVRKILAQMEPATASDTSRGTVMQIPMPDLKMLKRATSTTSSETTFSGLSLGAIVGASIGIFMGLLAILMPLACFCLGRRRRRKQNKESRNLLTEREDSGVDIKNNDAANLTLQTMDLDRFSRSVGGTSRAGSMLGNPDIPLVGNGSYASLDEQWGRMASPSPAPSPRGSRVFVPSGAPGPAGSRLSSASYAPSYAGSARTTIYSAGGDNAKVTVYSPVPPAPHHMRPPRQSSSRTSSPPRMSKTGVLSVPSSRPVSRNMPTTTTTSPPPPNMPLPRPPQRQRTQDQYTHIAAPSPMRPRSMVQDEARWTQAATTPDLEAQAQGAAVRSTPVSPVSVSVSVSQAEPEEVVPHMAVPGSITPESPPPSVAAVSAIHAAQPGKMTSSPTMAPRAGDGTFGPTMPPPEVTETNTGPVISVANNLTADEMRQALAGGTMVESKVELPPGKGKEHLQG